MVDGFGDGDLFGPSQGQEGTAAYKVLARIMGQRRSTRVFADRPVSQDVRRKLGQAFDSAPIAGGDGARRRLIFADHLLTKRLAVAGAKAYDEWLTQLESPGLAAEMRAYGSNFFWFAAVPLLAVTIVRRPPAFLATLGPKAELAFGAHLSAAMGLEAMLLAATSLGLGGCCLGGILGVAAELASFFGLGSREEISLMAAFGYPHEP